jgi:RNA polymerase sigma-70 factor (ECF subfamily)
VVYKVSGIIFETMSFEEIYTQFSPKIFRVCMGYVNDYEQARDLTQETFIAVWQNLPTFKNESKISTWIFRIATNNCLRAIERSKRVKITDLPLDLPVQEEEKQEEKLQFLYDCIAELEETERLIISLFLEDVPQAEIAAIVGLSNANVRVKVHRIKEKLAGKFKKHGRFD